MRHIDNINKLKLVSVNTGFEGAIYPICDLHYINFLSQITCSCCQIGIRNIHYYINYIINCIRIFKGMNIQKYLIPLFNFQSVDVMFNRLLDFK